uniref:Uncharacterized protein n=1 Tax=Anguilla anguilla TaxID=7936 RepID=A0A0E9X1R4_ANGAN
MLSLLFFWFQRFLKSTFLVKCIHIIVLFHDCCCCYFSSCYIFLFVKLVVFLRIRSLQSVVCSEGLWNFNRTIEENEKAGLGVLVAVRF